jgi:RNA-directed DNA polymerase
MHEAEKSDLAIVAVKPANNSGPPDAQRLDRIRKAARERKQEQFIALLHHVDVPMLRTAFYALRRDAAPGADGLTWQDYEADLDRRIEDLHDRVHRGAYRAQPSRRRFIPKPDGRQRPLAIAALEDKIVQRAVVMVLNAIYEEDFLGLSYGSRPGRSQHDALDAMVTGIGNTKVNWTRRRHPKLLRLGQPGMVDPVRGTSGWRPPHHPPDPEMAEGGHSRR